MRLTAAFAATLVVLLHPAPAHASGIEGTDARYVGGSMPQLSQGQRGRLTTTAPDALVFEYPGGALAIPYTSMQRFEYTVPLAHRLGVIPTLAVVLVKYRQRRHLVEVHFRDQAGTNQAVVLEISKAQAKPVVAVLSARVPCPATPSGVQRAPCGR